MRTKATRATRNHMDLPLLAFRVSLLALFSACQPVEEDQTEEERAHAQINDLFEMFVQEMREDGLNSCLCHGAEGEGDCFTETCPPAAPEQVATCEAEVSRLNSSPDFSAEMNCYRSGYHVEPITGRDSLWCTVAAMRLVNDCVRSAGCDPAALTRCSDDYMQRDRTCPVLGAEAVNFVAQCFGWSSAGP